MKIRNLIRLASLSVVCGTAVLAQSSDDSRLSGDYSFQALTVETRTGRLVQASSSPGSIHFGDNGVQVNGTAGAFREDRAGVAVIGAFLDGFGSFDARVADGAQAFLGVAPSFGGGSALLVGLRKPTDFSSAAFSGGYQATLVSFSGGSLRFGHATFQAANATLNAAADGTASLTLPGTAGLAAAQMQVAVSEDGDWIIGAPAGTVGLFVAARRGASGPGPRLWALELSADAAGPASAIGGLAASGGNRVRVYERWFGPRGAQDFRGETSVAIQSDGSGRLGATPIASAANGGLVGGIAGAGSGSMVFALPTPSPSDDDVFANPHGDVSAASFSPAGDPSAPGQLRSLFGANLADGQASAEALPLPTNLLGSSILVADSPTPLLFVSSGQVNYQNAPNAIGPLLRVVARNGDEEADAIFSRLAATSPAVFTMDGSGGGPGIFTHADFTLVTPQSPARAGETVIAFLTGLGVNQPLPRAWTGALAAEVLFAGPAPGFAGLDQMNFRIAAGTPVGPDVPFTIGTRDGWSDTVSIAIGP